MLFAGRKVRVRTVKTCNQGLENAARSPKSQFFTFTDRPHAKFKYVIDIFLSHQYHFPRTHRARNIRWTVLRTNHIAGFVYAPSQK